MTPGDTMHPPRMECARCRGMGVLYAPTEALVCGPCGGTGVVVLVAWASTVPQTVTAQGRAA